MALPPTFKVDIFSDVGWKTNQFALIAEASTYDEMKVAITNNVKGKRQSMKLLNRPVFLFEYIVMTVLQPLISIKLMKEHSL